jgi:DnaJ homolog subfamily C member 11
LHVTTLSFIRAARKALEEDSGLRRETLAVTELLKYTARRSKQAETSKQGLPLETPSYSALMILALGLVIVEATYGSVEMNDGAKDLILDVTVPLQALVRDSQLYVPADQTKVCGTIRVLKYRIISSLIVQHPGVL